MAIQINFSLKNEIKSKSSFPPYFVCWELAIL